MSFRMSCFLVEMPADAVVPASRRDETKTRMISMSLIGSVVAGLGENVGKYRIVMVEMGKVKLELFGRADQPNLSEQQKEIIEV